jgi:hypothetical protein
VAFNVKDQNFDALRALKAGDDAYIAYLKTSPLFAAPELQALIEAELKRTISENIGVCCFSEVPDDQVMFSHYGAGHEGCCLEFSTADSLVGQAFPIVYSDEPPTLDIFELNPHRFAQIMLGTKHSRWSYEREWRAIVHPMGASLQSIASTTLTGVILGYKCPPEKEAAVRALLTNRGTPRVELSKLFLESNGYSFQRRRLLGAA